MMSILTVGVGQQFLTIAAAVSASHDGDTVQIQAGTYVNDFATINTKITLQGVGGMASLVATDSPSDGKAILTVNTDVTMDHMEFSGAAVQDANGAGIRYQGGNLTLTNCYFHDNENGIMGNPPVSGTGTVTVRNSEFAYNGNGNGLTHNFYIGDVASVNIDNSYFHDAVVGHEIKSRAEQTTITNSRIQDGPDGTASYSIDMPNGGRALIQNNVIQQGPQSQNPAIIAFGEEGNVHAGSSLTVTGNTILNDLNSSSAVAVWNAAGAPQTVTGNSTYGLAANQVIRGAASAPGNTALATEPALVTTSMAAAVVIVAAHGSGQSQAFTFTGSFGTGAHLAAVRFINDAFGGTASTDRNLYVDGASLNGTAAAGATATLLCNGTSTFTATGGAGTPAPTPTPTPAPTPITTSTLVLHLSEDAYLGDAQFVASVDGNALGAAQSVTALHGLGKLQDFTFTGMSGGSFSAGPHDLAIAFTNDAWGGTPDTDRNLYVGGVDLNGAHLANATGTLFSNGAVHVAFTVPGS
jgi:hypothetical protein